VEGIDFHGFPRRKFGPILAKNKNPIKIFFVNEQYGFKLPATEKPFPAGLGTEAIQDLRTTIRRPREEKDPRNNGEGRIGERGEPEDLVRSSGSGAPLY
jgi:hypothetical protein